MSNIFLSSTEVFILIFLSIILLLPFNLFKKEYKLSYTNPLIYFSIIMIYYTLLSPLYRVLRGATYDRGYDFREIFILGWEGALLSTISVFLGYIFIQNKNKFATYSCQINHSTLWRYGLIINILSFLIYFSSRGFNLSIFNPFQSNFNGIDFLTYKGGLRNYLNYCINILISGNFLMFSSSFSGKKNYFISSISLILTILIYLSLGFRYRLFLLICPIFLYILVNGNFSKFKNLLFAIFGSIFSLILFTNFESINMMKFGLNRITTIFDLYKILITGETSTFLTTSGVINVVPEKLKFINFYPIYKTLIHPIPSGLFNKEAGDYIKKLLFAIYDNTFVFKGSAYLYFGEYYYMFGWFGIFIFSFLLGSIMKRLWIWINLHQDEQLAQVVYLSNLTYIFMIITRGYLPQQFHLYMFTVFPINFIYIINVKKKIFKS